jgi:hypothetical protein
VFVGIYIKLSGGLGRNLTELNNAHRMNPGSPENVNVCDIYSTASVLLSRFSTYLLHTKNIDLRVFCVTLLEAKLPDSRPVFDPKKMYLEFVVDVVTLTIFSPGTSIFPCQNEPKKFP